MNIANRIRQFLEQPGLEQEEIDEEVFFEVSVSIKINQRKIDEPNTDDADNRVLS